MRNHLGRLFASRFPKLPVACWMNRPQCWTGSRPEEKHHPKESGSTRYLGLSQNLEQSLACSAEMQSASPIHCPSVRHSEQEHIRGSG